MHTLTQQLTNPIQFGKPVSSELGLYQYWRIIGPVECTPDHALLIRWILGNLDVFVRLHLTAVETRLHVLESALGKLFPGGDMQPLATDLLLDQTTADNLDYGIEYPVSALDRIQFIDNYFAQYHVLYPLVHEESLRHDLSSQPPPPTCRLLSQIVLAIVAWLTPQSHQGLDTSLFQEAERQFQQIRIRDQSDIFLVQALILLGDLAPQQRSAEESEYYIGAALRVAMSLNLHREPPASLSQLDKEIRRRVWWSVYCAESCSAKIYGRPLLLPDENLITLYRRFLSLSVVTPKDVDEAQSTINAWHASSSFCVQVGDRSARPEWHFVARRRQILCDQSLRLLIHRPVLLHRLQRSSSMTQIDEAHCRANGLKIARATINTIAESLSGGHYSQLTLAFTLYALFHALIVPLIHLKTDPSSITSISCVQDLQNAKIVLDYLPVDRDAQSEYFSVILGRLFEVASQINDETDAGRQTGGVDYITPELQLGQEREKNRNDNDIFGGQEMALLEGADLVGASRMDFSEWLDL
ncbi:fungal-specific transcription factor domain-containing protein [Aspergillus crustosus]